MISGNTIYIRFSVADPLASLHHLDRRCRRVHESADSRQPADIISESRSYLRLFAGWQGELAWLRRLEVIAGIRGRPLSWAGSRSTLPS
jgi:hypothetical protein